MLGYSPWGRKESDTTDFRFRKEKKTKQTNKKTTHVFLDVTILFTKIYSIIFKRWSELGLHLGWHLSVRIYIYIYSSEEMEKYNRFFWDGGDVETPSHGFRSALNFE